MPKYSAWAKQSFVDRPLDKKDWEMILSLFFRPESHQRKVLEELRERDNKPLAFDWFQSHQIWFEVIGNINTKFRRYDMPYKLASPPRTKKPNRGLVMIMSLPK